MNTTGNQNTTGNAATATALATARTIGGVSFDGTANINLPGVNTTGNQNTTGNAATATALATARTIALTGDVTGSATFDGSGNISITTTSSGGGSWTSSGTTIYYNSGSVGVGTSTPSAKFHVYDSTGQSSWRDFYVRPTSLWGDGVTSASETAGTQYMTMNKIMFQGPHITPHSVGADAYIRYGRAGGVPSGVWWETACTTDGSFKIRREANDTYKFQIDSSGNASFTGQVYSSTAFYTDGNRSVIRGSSPTLYFRDTNGYSGMIHNNSNLLYVLRGATDSESWSAISGRWPWIFNLSNNDSTCGRNLYCYGNVTAYSDIRHKKDILKLDNSLEKVCKLNGYTYTRIDDDNRCTGVIAQEVLEVLPEAVNTDEKGEYAVAYGNMAGLFIEAFKELNSKLETAMARIKELENTPK